MKLKTRTILYRLVLSLITLIFIYVPCNRTYAGNINDNEATVLAVASGTFTYNGKTYKAKSEYISELYSFLADDDTDLTADQAREAIDYIFSNIKDGIDSGYVYEVGGSDNKNGKNKNSSDGSNSNDANNTNNSSDSNNPNDPANSNNDDQNHYDLDSKENQNPLSNSDSNGSDSQEDAKALSDKQLSDLFNKIDENQKLRDRTRGTASDTDATIIVDDSSITITTPKSNVKLYKDSRIIPVWILMTIVIISGGCLFINLLLAIILITNKCMRFNKQEKSGRRKGHRHRRKVRKICRNIMTVSSAISISLVCLILAIMVGFFNSGEILQNIQNSGYFRYAYTEYLTDIVESAQTSEVTDDTSANITGDTSADKTADSTAAQAESLSYSSYDAFIVQEKIAIDKTLAGSGTPDGTEISDMSIAPYIKRVQIDVKSYLIVCTVLSVLAVIISSVCNIFMDLRRDRGVKSIAISVTASVAVTFASALLLKMLHIESRFFVEPGYLYSFLADQMDWIIKVFVIIGLFTTAIAASLVGLYKSMRRER